jgi:predicted ATP-grasp superfamily ATP-dependent carboligase
MDDGSVPPRSARILGSTSLTIQTAPLAGGRQRERQDPLRLLVTDGTFKHTLGIVRQLGRDHHVFVAGERHIAPASLSRYAHRTLTYPSPSNSRAFLAWLDRVIREHAIDQVIPVGPITGEIIAEHRERWLPSTCVVIATVDQMRIALNKLRVSRLAAELGISVPRTRQPGSLDELNDAAAAVGYPLVIKAAPEGATDVAYVDEPAQLRTTFETYLRRNNWSSASLPLVQQRIVGPGYGVFATYQDGECRRVVAHRRIREFPATGGQSTCAELVYDPVLFDLGRRLLDALAWHGVAMVEFKRHVADGIYYLMEVNPKFWGSLDLDLVAGANFPGDLVAIGNGQLLTPVLPPNGSLRFCWPLYGDLRHLVERPQAWRAILSDWLNPGVRTNLVWSDPLPHFVELALTCRWLLCR